MATPPWERTTQDPALEFAVAGTRVALAAAAHAIGLNALEFDRWAEHHATDELPVSNEQAYELVRTMRAYKGAEL